jgi:hypothetical protein
MTIAITVFLLSSIALATVEVRDAATVKRVGGLVFVRLGRVGGSFYVARQAAQ